MEIPAPADLIRVWELGRSRPGWFRALLLLAPAFPDLSFDQLALLTIGQRNIALFRLRERMFGPELTAVVQCPRCGAYSEFTASIDELCPHELAVDTAAAEFDVTIDGVSVRCRCPTSMDLAALGEAATTTELSAALIDCCLQREPGIALNLQPKVIDVISDAVYERDPLLHLSLAIGCAQCGHEWRSLFDCESFFWSELGAACNRVLDDVHALATAYGWREADILAMSTVRRGFYRERVGS
jgi:hypothetical protein